MEFNPIHAAYVEEILWYCGVLEYHAVQKVASDELAEL